MPATSTPVKLKILNNLQSLQANGSAAAPATGLGLIDNSGTAYFTDVQKITRIQAGPMELKEFPAIVIVPMENQYESLASQGTLTTASKWQIQLTLVMRNQYHDGNSGVKVLEQFIRDVHKAVTVDRQRGGNAVSTRLVREDVFYPTEDAEPYTTANVIIEVEYRTPWDDLDTAT